MYIYIYLFIYLFVLCVCVCAKSKTYCVSGRTANHSNLFVVSVVGERTYETQNIIYSAIEETIHILSMFSRIVVVIRQFTVVYSLQRLNATFKLLIQHVL